MILPFIRYPFFFFFFIFSSFGFNFISPFFFFFHEQDPTPLGFILLENCRVMLENDVPFGFSIEYESVVSRTYVLAAKNKQGPSLPIRYFSCSKFSPLLILAVRDDMDSWVRGLENSPYTKIKEQLERGGSMMSNSLTSVISPALTAVSLPPPPRSGMPVVATMVPFPESPSSESLAEDAGQDLEFRLGNLSPADAVISLDGQPCYVTVMAPGC